MDTLQPLLVALQALFTRSEKKGELFSQIILAMIIPFGDGKASSIYRKLTQLLSRPITKTRFYRFMTSKCIPWHRIWSSIFKLIPVTETEGRVILALDDSTTPKTGKKIFGCEHFFDHAAKHNQSQYPWAQCFVQIGLLKFVHSRWAFLPLLSKFYHSAKVVATDKFSSKIEQACQMILTISTWTKSPLLVVMDTWFGNGKLYLPLKEKLGSRIHVLTMLRKNSMLYDFPDNTVPKRGRPPKYGKKLGSIKRLAEQYKSNIRKVTSFVYGKQREMTLYEMTAMSKSFKCKIKIVFAYYKNYYVALATTDLSLTAEQIVEYYSARWKIEAGFKELKHDIGSQSTQARLKSSVINHLNMSMLTTTLIWIAVMNLSQSAIAELTCQGSKTQFSFAKARALVISNHNKSRVYEQAENEPKIFKNPWLQVVLRLAA